MSTESVPVKVLYDAVGTIVSVELENGETVTGILNELQTNMNVLLTEATKTNRMGEKEEVKSVYIRGSSIVFLQLADALQTSPALVTAGAAISNALDKRGDGKGFGASRGRGGRATNV